jgi:predicted dehydrogenase
VTHIDIQQADHKTTPVQPASRRPRLGFLGVGWIGRHRLEAVAATGMAEIAAVADRDGAATAEALQSAPDALTVDSLDDLVSMDLDGVVIATPSGLHAEQAIAALECGLAVFCQKPLARTAAETRTIIDAARRADRLLSVDLSYRFVSGVPQMRRLVQSGALGRVYAADLTFHNAYGPDKPWFYDPELAGGGCVIDLGTHLADLALWMFDYPEFEHVDSRLFRQGRPIDGFEVEDYAVAQWSMRLKHAATEEAQPQHPNEPAQQHSFDAAVRLACSWTLSAGRDAVIEAAFYGTHGAVALRNVNGSFYDFVIERYQGTQCEPLAGPPDDWGGRAILDWTERLARGSHFDPVCERLADTAALVDAIYGR